MERPRFKDLDETLPIGSLLSALGIFFTVFSIGYVLTVVLCENYNIRIILFVSEAVLAFVSLFITLFIMTIKRRNKKAIDAFKKNTEACIECVESKMQDGFHHSGLLSFQELIEFEGTLADDPHPEQCYVLVYTSDLATEKDAEKQVENNLHNKVQYKVLYFQNSCGNETDKVEDRYGKNNLIDLSQIPEFAESFDGKLSSTLGFDIMIYQRSNGVRRGFFAVDFIEDSRRHKFRPFHDANCRDMCNYGTKGETFYKEMSAERAEELFNGIMHFFEKE